jgi:hypothetical protein
MKVVLTAFNGLLRSELKDWPDMPIDRPIQYNVHNVSEYSLTVFEGKEPFHRGTQLHRASFHFNGHTHFSESGDTVYEYELLTCEPMY